MSNAQRTSAREVFGLDGLLNGVTKRRGASQNHNHPGGEEAPDHLASIYEGQEDQFESIVPFIKQGLERGEQCLYVADENTEEEIREAFRSGGINVDAALASGALSIHTKADTYLRTGEFDPDAMLAFWQSALADACDEKGYAGLRAAAEMSWALDEETGLDRLVQYEALLNSLYAGEDYVVLCQYNRERFPPEVLSDVIRSHPLVVYDGTICQNFYYHPPDEFFGTEHPPLDIDRTVEGLVSRARTRQTLQDRDRYQHRLYQITSDPDLSFEEKLDALFELGCEVFDLEFGGLARVNPATDLFEVEAINRKHSYLVPGEQYPLSETYCQLATREEGPASVSDPVSRGFEGTLCYETLGVQAYLGTHLEFEGAVDRTFFFLSNEPRESPFSEAERTFHRLMGQWVEYELKKKQRENRLAGLNTLSREVMQAKTQREVGECVVEAAGTTLDLPITAIALYDEEDDALVLVAATDSAADLLATTSLLDRGDSMGWTAYTEGDSRRAHISLDGGGPSSVPPICEIAAFSLGSHGVLLTGAADSCGFNATTYDVLEMIAANAEAAFDRAYREQQLHERETELMELTETLEQRVEERTRQVRELTSRVTLAEQRERDRIARLLHDGLQQQLFGSQLQISSLRENAEGADLEQFAAQLQKVEGELKEIIRAMRQISVSMSPPVLESEGLVAAFEWLQSHMKEIHGLDTRLATAEEEIQVDDEMQVLLFQTTRELLTNVVEHSGTHRADVALRTKVGELVIEVIDEGSGFDPEILKHQHPNEEFGLTTARERIRLFGGDLNVHTAPGEGTRVTVRVPIG